MKYKVKFHPRAEKDLFELYDYINENFGPNRATVFLREIQSYCLGFSTFPHRGLIRDDIAKGIRVVGFKRIGSIAFAVLDDSVLILGVFYRGQNIAVDPLSDDETKMVVSADVTSD
ncbi:type II toxin-antitoxin system RelE/ParE family toxin [Phyllobacterium sp. SB3]|uniref:type II toxin-antitoxin system RelE/ParE family toxin n=1 Tax=Phyllobacterium sp. SB3 TaxID=3156073 RepID=UPI0032AF6B8B